MQFLSKRSAREKERRILCAFAYDDNVYLAVDGGQVRPSGT